MSKPHYYIDPSSSEPGALANDFLTKQGITMDNLEPKANNCTTVSQLHCTQACFIIIIPL